MGVTTLGIYLLLTILIGLCIFIALKLKNLQNQSISEEINLFKNSLELNQKNTKEGLSESRKEIRELNIENRKELSGSFKELEDSFFKRIRENQDLSSKQQGEINKQFQNGLIDVKNSIEKHLSSIREDNTKQLNEMRKTVDEKLQSTLEKRLGESFKIVSERLEVVHKGLGEMQSLATGVGDLKKVLSNVKTRGILGEFQLGNLLDQMLSPNQFEEQFSVQEGSKEKVDYVIKYPGKGDGQEVYLPIDSKFPLEKYNLLVEAYEKGNVSEIESLRKALISDLDGFAKSISQKYINPPVTTNFAILFLPIEGLYAEVLRSPGLFENLHRKYQVTITGPTTLSALLNSFQMGFKTIAIEKRSAEVWKVLSEVKLEFGKFSQGLDKVHANLNQAQKRLEELQTTRTNMMERKLRPVESLDAIEAPK